MLSRGFTADETEAEAAVLDEVSRILVDHLDHWNDLWAGEDTKGSSPVLIHIEGRGRTLFLDRVSSQLDPTLEPVPDRSASLKEPRKRAREASHARKPRASEATRWTVIGFDAWQHQRVAPPWWWLIKAIDTQTRDRLRSDGVWPSVSNRLRDYGWRGRQLGKDLILVVPVIVVALAIAAGAWKMSGGHTIGEVLQWAATAIAAVTTIAGVGWSAGNALRRHLLVESPVGASAVLRTSDPMAELKRRYRFLIESAGTPVAILVDNLDRCRADYVVELLEGVQTLLKQADPTRDLPLVVYLVAADQAWLCDSYLQTYEQFGETTQQVGRPFGLAFLDKIFDLSLTIPKVSVAASRDFKGGDFDQLPGAASLLTARCELEVRQRLHAAEHRDVGELPADAAAPVQQGLRLCAARRLAQLESDSDNKACADTEDDLTYLAERADPGAEVVRDCL